MLVSITQMYDDARSAERQRYIYQSMLHKVHSC